jgi:hypothetical protein
MTKDEARREFFRSISRVKRTPDRLPQRESTEMLMRRVRRVFSTSRIIRGERHVLAKRVASRSA